MRCLRVYRDIEIQIFPVGRTCIYEDHQRQARVRFAAKRVQSGLSQDMPPKSVCVCVSTPGQRVHNQLRQGRVALSPYHTQRSCGREWEAGPDQPCVPAFNTPTPMVHPAAVRCFHGPSCYCPSNTGSSATCSRREFSQRATAVTRQTFLLKHLHICGLFTLPFLHHF